jgi:hypothetical protein
MVQSDFSSFSYTIGYDVAFIRVLHQVRSMSVPDTDTVDLKKHVSTSGIKQGGKDGKRLNWWNLFLLFQI